MQRDPYVAKASELMRLDIMPSLAEIKAGKVSVTRLSLSTVAADLGGQNILDIPLIAAA